MLQLEVSAVAAGEILNAFEHYSNISPQLATSFYRRVESALNLLCGQPKLGSLRFAHLISGLELRAWTLDRFPYRILYVADDTVLHVLHFHHERQRIAWD